MDKWTEQADRQPNRRAGGVGVGRTDRRTDGRADRPTRRMAEHPWYLFDALVLLNKKFYFLDFPEIITAVPGKSNVMVRWKYPFDGECPVTSYTVYYRNVMKGIPGRWQEVIVSRNKLQTTLQVKCSILYQIAVTAWSSHGETLRNQNTVEKSTFGGTRTYKMFTLISFFCAP